MGRRRRRSRTRDRFRSSGSRPHARPSNRRRSSAGWVAGGAARADPDDWLERWTCLRAALGDADELELDLERLVIKRFHDIFVCTSLNRFTDMGHVVFRGAEHHLRPLAAGALAQMDEEFDPTLIDQETCGRSDCICALPIGERFLLWALRQWQCELINWRDDRELPPEGSVLLRGFSLAGLRDTLSDFAQEIFRRLS